MMNSGAFEDRKRKASSELDPNNGYQNGVQQNITQPQPQPINNDADAAAKAKLTSSIQEMNDLFDYVKQDTRGLSDEERRKMAEKVGAHYPGDANPKEDRAVGPDDRDEIFDMINAVKDSVSGFVAAAKEAIVGPGPDDGEEQDKDKVKGETDKDAEDKGITTTVQEKVHDMAHAAQDYGIAAKDKVVEMGTVAKEKCQGMAHAAQDYGIAAKDKVVEMSTAAKEKAADMASSTSEAIANKYNEVREKVVETKDATVNKSSEYKEKAMEAYSEKKAELEQIASNAKHAATDYGTTAKDKTSRLYTAAKDAATDFGTNAKEIFSDPEPTPEDKATEQEVIDAVNGAVFGSSKQKEQLEHEKELQEELYQLDHEKERLDQVREAELGYRDSVPPVAPCSQDVRDDVTFRPADMMSKPADSFKPADRKWDVGRQQQPQYTQGL